MGIKREWICALVIFIAFGIAGSMDMHDAKMMETYQESGK